MEEDKTDEKKRILENVAVPLLGIAVVMFIVYSVLCGKRCV